MTADMNKVYKLTPSTEEYAVFYETAEGDMFIDKYYNWNLIDIENYTPVQLKIAPADNGSKSFKMDISIYLNLVVLSEKAVEALKDILDSHGQILPILTDSKRKKFFGFYPNKNVYGDEIINLEKSKWSQENNGKFFEQVVFNNKMPCNDYLFTSKDLGVTVYVTDKFKELVEKHDLKGLDFSHEVTVEG